MLLLRLSQGISSGCHHATLTPKKVYFGFVIIWEGVVMLLLRLSQGISSGCTMPPLHQFFRKCHYCGKGALCFCFDLAKVILQGATMPPLHLIFFRNCHFCGKGHYASASNSRGVSSGSHHATPAPIFFRNCHYFGKGHYASASTYLRFFRVPPCHPYTKNWNYRYFGRGSMLLLRLSQSISSGCHHATHTPKIFLELSIGTT